MNPNGRVRVRCAFYVARHDAIYTMSISAADNYREMSACVTTVANVLEGRCTESWRMLPGETLKYPDFVELDEVNDKVITYTEREHTFSVWTFAARPEDHRLLYRLSEATGHEMRAVAGLLLIVHHRTPTHVQVDLRAVETGERLESARFALHRGLKLQWFEVHERKVLLKEEGGPLQIWDLVTRARVELEPWHFSRGTRFAVEQGVVLALTAGRCVAWDLGGRELARLPQRLLPSQERDPFSALALAGPRPGPLLLLSHGLDDDHDDASLRITDLRAGRLVARLSPRECPDRPHAFRAIAAIAYSDLRDEIYTVNEQGRIFVWAA